MSSTAKKLSDQKKAPAPAGASDKELALALAERIRALVEKDPAKAARLIESWLGRKPGETSADAAAGKKLPTKKAA